LTALLGKTGAYGRASPLPAAIVATACGFVAVVRGAADTFAVFLLPLEESLGLGHAETTSIFALAMIAVGVTGPFAGTLVDRFGPRTTYGIGIAVLIVAFVAASTASMLWQLQLTLGIGVGAATACVGTSAQGPLIGRWFRGREATIFGIISGMAGFGALVFAPLSQLLIETWGWRGAYQALALIVSLLLLPLALLPWRQISAGPGDDGGTAGPAAGWESHRRDEVADAGWRRILMTPLLWRLFASHFLTCAAVFGIQVLIVAYLVDSGYAPLTAAAAVGVAGLATALGVMLFAWLSDRVGWRRTLTASFAATGVGVATLWAMNWEPAPWLLGLYILSFGLSVGSRGPLIAGLAMRRFAGPASGRVLGGLLLAFGLGGATGSSLAGVLHEATGGYGAGFAVSSACLVLAFLLWWIWPDPSRVEPAALSR
jgi:MFS family permease